MYLMYRKFIPIFIATISLFSQSLWAYDPTTDIQNAFCNDLGPYSNAAQRHARELLNIISNIENDPACEGMFQQTKGYLNEVMEYQSQYNSPENGNRAQARIEYIENEIQVQRAKVLKDRLSDFLAKNPYASMEEIYAEAKRRNIHPTSPTVDTLEYELANSKLQLFEYQIEHDLAVGMRSQTSRFGKIERLQRGLDSLFSVLNTSNACGNNNKNMFTKIGAQVLGASGSIYGGALGSALIAGGSFLNGLGRFFTHLKLKAKEDEIENVNLSIAVGCGMEGMAKLYCQARDTRQVVKFTVEHSKKEDDCVECKDYFRGLDLIGRQIHVYNKWITNVISGSSPSSGSQADQRIAAFNLRFQLTSSKESIYGKIGETKNLIDQISGPDADKRKNEFRLGLMNSLANQIISAGSSGGGGCVGPMCGGSGENTNNPFKNSFTIDSYCGPFVYLYSDGLSRVSQKEMGEGCQDYLKRAYPDVVLSLFRQKELMERLFQEGEDYVSLRIQSVFEENPMKILARFEIADPEYDNSPKQFINELYLYLSDLLEKYSRTEHPGFVGLINTMQNRVKKALAVVTTPICMDSYKSDCVSAASQVTDLGNILAPQQETRSVENAMKFIVTQDLNLKLKEKPEARYMNYLRKVSKERSVNFFIKNYLDIHKVLTDVSRAQMITRANVKVLSDLFAKRYIDYLKDLKEVFEADSGDLESRELFAELCFQALHAPDDSDLFDTTRIKKVGIAKLCSAVKYVSYVPNKVPHLVFKDLVGNKYRKRICQMYDFKNSLEIYQVTRDAKTLEQREDLEDIEKPYDIIVEE